MRITFQVTVDIEHVEGPKTRVEDVAEFLTAYPENLVDEMAFSPREGIDSDYETVNVEFDVRSTTEDI